MKRKKKLNTNKKKLTVKEVETNTEKNSRSIPNT